MSFENGTVINARVRSILDQSESGLDAFRIVSKLFDYIRRPAVQSFRIRLEKYAEGKMTLVNVNLFRKKSRTR
jgi:hypothetical protein